MPPDKFVSVTPVPVDDQEYEYPLPDPPVTDATVAVPLFDPQLALVPVRLNVIAVNWGTVELLVAVHPPASVIVTI